MPLKAGVDVILSSLVNCLCEKKIKSRQVEGDLRLDLKVRNSVRKNLENLIKKKYFISKNFYFTSNLENLI